MGEKCNAIFITFFKRYHVFVCTPAVSYTHLQVKKYYGDKVFKAVIPRSVRLSEAPSFGMPINFYEPNGKGCEAYMELAREFLSKNER